MLAQARGSSAHRVGSPYFSGYVAFNAGMHVFSEYLELRQLRKNRERATPT